MSLEWMTDAACATVGTEAWFPESGRGVGDAKRVCKSCEVRDECLEYALENNETEGVWGGLSARERAALRPTMRADEEAA